MNNFELYKNWSFPIEEKEFSCLNTVKYIINECHKNISLKNCIQICEKDENCDAGMYIENKDKSVCFPYNTGSYPDLNPLNSIVAKNTIPKLKGFESTIFINGKKYEVPDYNSAKVYETDHVFLKNVETGLYMNHPTNYEEIYSDIKFSSRKDPIVIIEDNQTRKKELKYLIKNFDKITFLIPKTFFIPYVFQSDIHWIQLFGDSDVDKKDFIQIRMNTNNFDDNVTYGQIFTLYYRNYIVGLDSKNKLGLFLKPTNKISHKFVFEANWKGYYCKNKICKSVPFNQTNIKNSKAIYKKSPVFRNKNCYNQC